MPQECKMLKGKRLPILICPECGACNSADFMRGKVQCWWRKVLGMRYCAVICSKCKEIIGWEK